MKIVRLLLLIVLLLGVNLTIPSAKEAVCWAHSHSISIDDSSAWFLQDKQEFGASVSIDGAAYKAIAYKLKARSDGSYNVYQMKNNSGQWIYLGIKGVDKHAYLFPSELSIDIFIRVANTAAHTKGYDHMF